VRVWIVTTSYPRNPDESINAGVLVRDAALVLKDRGLDVTVVTPDKPGGILLDRGINGIVLSWIWPTLNMADLSPRRPADWIRITSLFATSAVRLWRRARRRPPDAIVAFWAIPSGVFARWIGGWSGAPYVVWLLGSDVWKVRSFPLGQRLLRFVLRGARATYADGRELASEAEKLTGIDVRFLPSSRRLPRDAGLEAEPVDILFIGRYHPNKGPDVLIEAFALAHQARPDLTLRLHGLGELRADLEQQVSRLGLTGAVQIGGPLSATEVRAALEAAKVLAIPSRIESVPLILGDAGQAGVPVVVSDVGDMRELVDQGGLGYSVPAEDPAALSEALLLVVEGGLESRVDAARSDGLSIDRAIETILRDLEPEKSQPAR